MAEGGTTSRTIAAGDGWQVAEVVCRSGPGDRTFEEAHGRTAIAAVLSGVFTYRSRRGGALLAPGAMLLGDGGTHFECGHEHGTGDRCVSFFLAPALIEETRAGLDGISRDGFRRPDLPPVDVLLPLFAEARRLAGTSAPDPLRAEVLTLAVARTALALDAGQVERRATLREERKAAQAARIVDARHAEPLSLARLAAEVGLGRQRFALAFRRAVGVSPYRYILRRRLETAAGALRDGGASVLDVALASGFGDLSEFTRRFKRRFGVSPGAYRRQP